jgi:nucleotide-binding universal stress UspA family protein
MLKTIVVGADRREGGRDALALAASLSRKSDAELVVVRDLPYDYYATRAGSPPFAVAEEEDARADLDAQLADAGLGGRVRILGDTSPARALHRVAEEEHAELIVVGSTHLGRFGRVLLGDHAAGTVHASPCPVAVTPRGFARRERATMGRIGVGYDGREEAGQALRFAADLARMTPAVLEVVSVVGSPVLAADAGLHDHEWMDAAIAEARRELDQALRGIDVAHHGEVVAGLVGEQLVKLSCTVDLMVVGSRAWGPVRRVLLGSVAAQLMREAHCPVIVLPRGAATGEPGERDPGASAVPA